MDLKSACNATPDMLEARDQIVAEIRNLLSFKQTSVVIAIDGGSGAGKSTLANLIEDEIDVAMIPLDDFFSADIPDSKWHEFSVKEKFKHVFKWDLVRKDVFEPLKSKRFAQWFSFDFDSGLRPDGTYGLEDEPKIRKPADVILLEGAYSASPEFSDLVDLAILVDVPVQERHARLNEREDTDFLKNWHEVWDEVEEYYFNKVRPRSSFDLVVRG